MIKINQNNRINAKDIYSLVDVKTIYWNWLKRCIKYADLELNKDFITVLEQSTGGRPETLYFFTIDAAKEICLVSQTSKAKELRRWLIDLGNKVESYDLLNHEQIIELVKLKEFFKYIENQKEITKQHLNSYVIENHNLKNPFAEFHIWRNKMLNIDKHILDEQIKLYCIEKSKKLPKIQSNFDKIRFLNEYDNLRNAVWDFLEIKGEINSLKLANLVKKMAEAENLKTYIKNETNLFQKKENIQKSLNQ